MNSYTDDKPQTRCFLRLARLATAAALLAIASPGSAAVPQPKPAGGVPPLLSLIRKNYHPNASIETKFTLVIYWIVREKEEKKLGSVSLAPGDRFRVTAGNETWVSDGSTLWNYNADTKQAVVRRLADVDRTTLPSHIFDAYIASYPFLEKERSGETALLVWKSDSAKTPYSEIEVTANTKNGRILKCTLVDGNGNRFTYTFTATVFGKKYAKEAFQLAIPKDARVIDMRNR